MNRRVAAALFILGASIVNIIAMVVIFAILLLAYGRFLAPSLAPSVNQIVVVVLFFATVALTYVLYAQGMRALAKTKRFGPFLSSVRGDQK